MFTLLSGRASSPPRHNGRLPGNNAPGTSRSRWRKPIVAIAVLGTFLFLFGPRESRHRILNLAQSSKDPFGVSSDAPGNTPTIPPLETPFCTTPYDTSKELVQYALMIDAGSTGSRIHIYKFHNCFQQPSYESEVFLKKQPGLSSFSNPSAAAESLDELLDEAVKHIPPSLHSCTPVAVKATAGLRLKGKEASEAILKSIRARLHAKYPFPLSAQDSVAIMDGKDEGVYAWLTVNYLLDLLGASPPTNSATYAVLDLGGGSTQIVFEPERSNEGTDGLLEGEHKYVLRFAGRNHTLYQHSYLGYGLMSARKSTHRLAAFMGSFNQPHDHPPPTHLANPCIAKGESREIALDDGRKVKMDGMDVGSFAGCKRLLELVLAKDAVCQIKPCSFNGVYQPSLLDAFPTGKVLLLSYFYDRLAPLLSTPNASNSVSLKVSQIATLAETVCEGRGAWTKRFRGNKLALEELDDRPEYCLDLSFMYTLLRLGYEFSDSRMVTIAKKVGQTELGWALGAGIALIGAQVECKA